MTDGVNRQPARAQRWLARLTADAAQIPVGIDGEAVPMQVPVTCAIWARALRVWVPRERPGVPKPKPALDWARLLQLAGIRREQAGMAA